MMMNKFYSQFRNKIDFFSKMVMFISVVSLLIDLSVPYLNLTKNKPADSLEKFWKLFQFHHKGENC